MRPLSVIPWAVGFGSAALLAYACYTAWDDSRVPVVRVEVPDVTLDTARVGRNTIEYHIVNDGPGSVLLLGGEAHCFTNC